MTIQEARKNAERKAGIALDDTTFDEVLAYTRYKAQVTGHDEEYVPLLLMDEIKDYIFRENVNRIYFEAKEIEKMFLQMVERGEQQCAKSACIVHA